MIRIVVTRDVKSQVQQVLISGHAEYGDHGKDIVCAAVSAISIGMCNAVEKLLGIQIVSVPEDTGELDIRLPHFSDIKAREQVHLLVEAMVVALVDVADAYDQYVKINFIKE